MNPEDLARSRVVDDASEWVIRLMHDTSPNAIEGHAAWLAESPLHREVFAAVQRAWHGLNGLDQTFEPLGAPAHSGSVVDLPVQRRSGPLLTWIAECNDQKARRVRTRRMRTLSLAAAIGVLVVGYLMMTVTSWPVERYSTPIGSQQTIKLSDGSIIQMNTQSRVEVRIDDHIRDVRILEGEALFTVAHDPGRPFYVSTDNLRIRAIGTKFNVYRQASGTTRVAVLEGIVQVSTSSVDSTPTANPLDPKSRVGVGRRPGEQRDTDQGESDPPASALRLVAGDEAAVTTGFLQRIATADVQRAIAWRTRKLVFDAARVDEMAAEFNRYNLSKIVILDEAIGARHMAGTFEADDPSPLLAYLSRDPDIRIVKAGSEIRVSLRGHSDRDH